MLAEARTSDLMDRLRARKAFLVEGAHLYGHLLDFNELVSERNNQETEASHRNVLSFLNMHYRIWDSIVDDDEANRIDYHGARLLFVTLP